MIALLLVHASSVRADDAAIPDAQGWFARGLALSRLQQWPEARNAYLHSLALEPRVSTHFNLAVVSLKLRLGRETLLALDDFARMADPRQHTEFLHDSLVLRARALDLTGLVELTISPAGTVQVDQAPSRSPPAAVHTIHLDPGHHSLLVSAPHHLTQTREFEIAVGDAQRAHVELLLDPAAAAQPLPVALAVPPASLQLQAAPTPEPRDEPRWKRKLLWSGISVLAASAIATTVAVVVHQHRADDPRPSGGSIDMVF